MQSEEVAAVQEVHVKYSPSRCLWEAPATDSLEIVGVNEGELDLVQFSSGPNEGLGRKLAPDLEPGCNACHTYFRVKIVTYELVCGPQCL